MISLNCTHRILEDFNQARFALGYYHAYQRKKAQREKFLKALSSKVAHWNDDRLSSQGHENHEMDCTSGCARAVSFYGTQNPYDPKYG